VPNRDPDLTRDLYQVYHQLYDPARRAAVRAAAVELYITETYGLPPTPRRRVAWDTLYLLLASTVTTAAILAGSTRPGIIVLQGALLVMLTLLCVLYLTRQSLSTAPRHLYVLLTYASTGAGAAYAGAHLAQSGLLAMVFVALYAGVFWTLTVITAGVLRGRQLEIA
jgi:hypothetical protein